MKGGSIFKKIIYSSGFLAIIPAIIVMFLLSPMSSKYTLLVEPVSSLKSNNYYRDLNSDSISEVILVAKGYPYYYILVQDSDMRVYDQWNLSDSINPIISDFFFGNYDHDRYEEIFIFTHKRDSLFLNVNEFLEPSGTLMNRIFITKTGFLKGEITSTLQPVGFFDENGDGQDELYFTIHAGFGLQPRKLYYFDLVNKSLVSSQLTGSMFMNAKMVDIDGDKRPEIFGLMGAGGNYKSKVPYSDNSAWLMIFNDHLKFEFEPVEFPGFANYLDVEPYRNSSFQGYLASLFVTASNTRSPGSHLSLFSTEGKLIRYRLYKDLGISHNVILFTIKHSSSDKIYLFGNKFIELNEKLEPIRKVNLPFHTYSHIFQTDIDNDGKLEFLIYSDDEGKIALYSEDFEKLAEQRLKTNSLQWKISHFTSKNLEHKLFISDGTICFFLKLNRNTYYLLGYMTYPGIYVLIFIFILFIKRINTWQVVEKESLNRRLVTLQLQGIKSQLDPHFTFNTLNSIASLIYLEDRQLAYDYMNKFTNLMRSLINDAERIYRSLGEEIEFVITYLELEKLRFGDKFNYEILIGEGVNKQELVPKLVLHTFAENAIKHGIMSRAEGGFLKISAVKKQDCLVLSVEDNGIGRAKAEGQSTSTGKGIRLTREFYDILNQLNKKPIKHLIIDLHNSNGDPAGTRVEVWVPLDLSGKSKKLRVKETKPREAG